MKIGPEHIGKTVRLRLPDIGLSTRPPVYEVEVYYIGKDNFLDKHCRDWPLVSANGTWELVEELRPVKKPSERIAELSSNLGASPLEMAIIDYLDEVMPGLLEKK